MIDQQLRSYWTLHRNPIILVVLGFVFCLVFGYALERDDTIRLFSLYGALFFLAYKLIQLEKFNFRFLLVTGILFRLAFLFALPELSNDFYRFLWDGQLLLNGYNPYLFSPEQIYHQLQPMVAYASQLYEGMSELSKKNYSNYPPLHQIFFLLAVSLGGKSLLGGVVALRVLLIGADLAVFYLGRKLLKEMNRSPHTMYWYLLNPLVIVELTGNLHLEGVMLAFFLGALLLIVQGKWLTASLSYAAAVVVKLVPLIALPLAIPYLGWKKGIVFGLLVAGLSLLSFVPFFNMALAENYTTTVGLWFSNFEFNAGIYNLVKLIATQSGAKPWILIGQYGKVVLLLVILLTILLTFWRRQVTFGRFCSSMLLLYTVFYLLGATVHPWYIILPLTLGLFTDYRYPLAWSLLVVLSYAAYSSTVVKEHMGLLLLEYSLLFGAIGYELWKIKRN